MSAMTFNERANGLRNRAIFLALLPAGFAYAAFSYNGDDGKAVTAAASLYVIMTAFQFFWDLRRRVWFWVMMSIIGGMHAGLVVAIRWSNGPYPVPLLVILLPAVVLDFSAIYQLIRLGETVMPQNSG
jgi:Na+/melibiose symporter-like transporter